MREVGNQPSNWLSAFPFPQPEGHKYTRGHALILGGEIMTGAARLAARAAQRVGAGLVTVAAPANALPIYATALESVIVRPCPDMASWNDLLTDPKRNALLLGPGLGPDSKEQVLAALSTRKASVLDADALTAFADNPSQLFTALHPACVLTPHEGEFARLFGKTIDPQSPKPQRALHAAQLAGCVVLLKGHETVIASPDGAYVVNRNAPPYLATAGSGDVLAGMILGLIAQKMPCFQVAAAAAWLHGEAAQAFGLGLIAEDLIDRLPPVLQDLSKLLPAAAIPLGAGA